MLSFRAPSHRNKRAFSLVEILLTISVIAVITGISVPLIAHVLAKSQDTAARRNAQAIAGLASSASAAGSTAIITAPDKETAVDRLTQGVNGEGEFSSNRFVFNLDEDQRESTLNYLEFDNGTLEFDPTEEED